MQAQSEIRKALAHAEEDRKAASVVTLELIGIGLLIGYAKGPWYAGVIASLVLFLLFMIPYVRVLTYLAVSAVWAIVLIRLVDGAAAFDRANPELSGPALGAAVLAFSVSLYAHFAFRRHMNDLDRSATSSHASDEKSKGRDAAAEERECPMCAEMIKAKAKKCRYCGSSVDPLVNAKDHSA